MRVYEGLSRFDVVMCGVATCPSNIIHPIGICVLRNE